MNKLTLQDMHNVASSRGGKCLSTKYVNNRAKLRWQCSEGHQWDAAPAGVRNQHSWCPICARKSPITLQDMHDLAASRGGKCLSTKYVNNRTKLRWQCSEGHQWEVRPSSIRNQGSWCRRCARKRTKR